MKKKLTSVILVIPNGKYAHEICEFLRGKDYNSDSEVRLKKESEFG